MATREGKGAITNGRESHSPELCGNPPDADHTSRCAGALGVRGLRSALGLGARGCPAMRTVQTLNANRQGSGVRARRIAYA